MCLLKKKMTKKKIILAFTGMIASGKGTAAKYLVDKYCGESKCINRFVFVVVVERNMLLE